MVYRVCVEKKPGLAPECASLLSDCRSFLDLKGLESVRIWNRYDVEGIDEALFAYATNTVFSEPQLDLTSGEIDASGAAAVFAVEPLPGQFDQRADSAAQCIQLLSQGERPRIRTAKVYALYGTLSEKDVEAVKHHVINPVESREASLAKPETLAENLTEPKPVASVGGFIAMDESALSALLSSMGLAMDLDDLKTLQAYFRDEEHRDPTVTEVRVVDTYWSDHCRHTTFSTHLDEVSIENPAVKDAYDRYLAAREEVYGLEKAAKRPQTLMDIATIGTKTLKKRGLLPELDESEEINACSIEVPVQIGGKTETYLIQFKNETHNHPTEIEPFGGAATCLGGAIRDPLSGRSYVYQAMRVTGSGNPLTPFEETIPGKLPQRKITLGAAKGYSSYGNQIGLSTGQVAEVYDEGYVAKRMEIGAVVAASPKKNVRRERPKPGDIIVLLGGRTGRDGCGGATGSSKAHDSASIETCGAEVQKGNPPTERKLQRLFRNPEASTLIKRCNDFGAGGVCVAIGELAPGLTVDLDKVPKKYDGLDGTELAISESQERMAVVLNPEDVKKFIRLAGEENLEATPVACVTEEPVLRMTWRGDEIVHITRAFLDTNGVTQKADALIAAADPADDYRTAVPAELRSVSGMDALKKNLSRLPVCSQKGLSERFDSSIGAATVLMPFAGKTQLTPENVMAAAVPTEEGAADTATVMSYGFIPGISKFSPFHGAAYAVVHSLVKLAASGADTRKAYLTFQEYFERLGSAPERWGKPAAALLGALTAQLNLNVASIGGKDSMSGSFNDLDVPPTLVSFAIAPAMGKDIHSCAFTGAGEVVLLKLPVCSDTLVPDWARTKEFMENISALVRSGDIVAAGVVDEGGASAAVCKMAFGNELGFDFADGLTAEELYAPMAGCVVAQVRPGTDLAAFDFVRLGTVNENGTFSIGGETAEQYELVNAYTHTLESVFPTDANAPAPMTEIPLYTERSNAAPAIKTAKPRVIIPVFPGTNCEYDTARAFEKAGAEAKILVMRNLTPADIDESIAALEREIRSAQILMIPGGFSGGDEPDGSGKFIATTLRSARVRDAVMELLNNRDGLALGICNGFQALIKVGLLPYGEIRETQPDDPTLTFNTIGRHVSQMVYTRVTSVKSPWMSGVQAGDIHCIPVSHGEGRFVASAQWVRRLTENGQIATQYVDLSAKPTAYMPFNPNGSVCAIEGITSPDGRVFGKMGHSERSINGALYKNVPGVKDQQIFASGVAYFTK